MPPLARVVAVLWLLQVLYGPFKAWISRRLLRRQRRIFAQTVPERFRRALLIVPAKGAGPDFGSFLHLVMHQDYPDYRIILVTESGNDPAAIRGRAFLGLAPGESVWRSSRSPGEEAREVEFVEAGLSRDEGQKVHNQRAALARMRPEDEIIAFADADIVGSREWLQQLFAPLNLHRADISSGYRWLIPSRPGWVNWLASNLNGDIAFLSGPSWCTLLWGGSMAMTRETFEALDVPSAFRGCLNDDLQLTRIARESRKRMVFVRGLMAPSPVDYDWSRFWEFACRQYFQVRMYVPLFWGLALFFTTLWLAGVSVVWWGALHGSPVCPWLILGSSLAILLTHQLRQDYLRDLFEPEVFDQIRGARSIIWFTTTLNFFVHWLIVLTVIGMNGIVWAGIRYRVRGRQQVEVLSRD
ncbi:MAG: hypothetical protein KGS60_09475 [Verrucomicrobia bacterium]|nr:hypothetical protein [Verrucomicrobiota bacterium]